MWIWISGNWFPSSNKISPGCSLEGMMLKLELQYFGHLMRRVDSLGKTLRWEGLEEGGEVDDRVWDGWMASPTRWTWVWVNSGSWWRTGRPGVLRFMGSQRVGHDWVTELNWTEGVNKKPLPFLLVSEEARWEPWTCTLHGSNGGLINEEVQ